MFLNVTCPCFPPKSDPLPFCFSFPTNALILFKGLYIDYNALIRNRIPDAICDFFFYCIFKISIFPHISAFSRSTCSNDSNKAPQTRRQISTGNLMQLFDLLRRRCLDINPKLSYAPQRRYRPPPCLQNTRSSFLIDGQPIV